MRCASLQTAVRVGLLWMVAVPQARTQEMPDPQMMQARVQRIVQERPPEAEAAAREFLLRIAPDRAAAFDDLSSRSPEEYWHEIGQLVVQSELVQGVSRRDTSRARGLGMLFGTEAEARALQRAYRDASAESERRAIRGRLEQVIVRRFDLEDQLHAREIADIQQRLAAVRAEVERRRQRRSELVRWAVEGIIHAAQRP